MLPVALILIIIIAIFLWYYYYYKPFAHWKKLGIETPASSPWVFLGDFWPVFIGQMNLSEIMEKFYSKRPNSRYEAIYHLSVPTLLIKDPELIKLTLVKDFDHFTDHINFAPSEDPDGLWSRNLLMLTGQQWRDTRALVTGAFTGSKMRLLHDLIIETSTDFVRYFKDKNEPLIEMEFKEYFTRFATDTIATVAFGLKVDSLQDPENEFYLMGKKATNFSGISVVLKMFLSFLFPQLLRRLKINFIPSEVTDFFYNSIKQTIRAREEQNIVRPDLLHLLLEAKRETATPEGKRHDKKSSIELTTKAIAAHALTFFIAGFESTTMLICFTCHELAVNPDVQKKLRAEIRDTYRKNDGQVSYEALQSMKYFDALLSESLRKWPVIPLLDRVCTKPYTVPVGLPEESAEITLEPGHRILIPVRSIQHDPEYYPDPEKFDPDRFGDDNRDTNVPYTYLPFGTGPRSCLGNRLALMEVKTVLFHLLKDFAIVPTERTQIPLKLKRRAMSTAVEGGFQLALKRLED